MTTDKIASTDAALGEWRDISVQRKEEWEAQQERARTEARRRFYRRAIPILGASLAGAVLLGITATSTLVMAAVSPSAPDELALLEGTADEFEVPQVAVVADEVLIESAPIVEPIDAPQVTPPPIVFDPIVVEGSLQAWGTDTAQWTRMDYAFHAPIELRYRDAAGAPVLSNWPCDNRVNANTRRCYVGRTRARIARDVAAGATPGIWEVLACGIGAESCVPVATFEVE